MKIVLISDTHCQLNRVNIPDGDLLIHCGDATNQGSIQEIIQFNEHLGMIENKFEYGIVVTPGNHDFLAEKNPGLYRSMITNAQVRIHEPIKFGELNFFLSPFSPEFCNWAFNVKRGTAIKRYWDQIPNDTNVLITHGPPHNFLDLCPDGFKAGCKDLFNRILELEHLELHAFGHIHHQGGQMINFNGVTFVNAAVCDERYKPTNSAVVIDL